MNPTRSYINDDLLLLLCLIITLEKKGNLRKNDLTFHCSLFLILRIVLKTCNFLPLTLPSLVRRLSSCSSDLSSSNLIRWRSNSMARMSGEGCICILKIIRANQNRGLGEKRGDSDISGDEPYLTVYNALCALLHVEKVYSSSEKLYISKKN